MADAGFTIEDIARRVREPGRRARLCDGGQILTPPTAARQDWAIRLPFTETWLPALATIGIQPGPFRCGLTGCAALLPGISDSALARLQIWLNLMAPRVAMRDLFAMSFALDYRTLGGDEMSRPTKLGEWAGRAKAYEGYKSGPEEWATHCLVQELLNFIRTSGCFDSCDAVVAVPGSNPAKVATSLPRLLAAGVSAGWGRPDLSAEVRSLERSVLKEASVTEKLSILHGAIEVDATVVRGKTVLLVDDLYQSGTTMNYLALCLLEAGAQDVRAVACVKTMRDDDNTSWLGRP